MNEKILKTLDGVYLACIWSAGIAIFFMSIIIPVGVFARYVLGFGAQWPEPIAMILMVIFTFLGAAASYRAGAHIAVAMLTDRLPTSLRKYCVVLVDICMLAICLFGVIYGTKLCLGTMAQNLAELPWLPVGFTYAPLPLGALLTMFFVIEKIVFGSQHARAIVTFDHSLEESVVTDVTSAATGA
jgi:TRAP-type C4-dicarboxylate transport system permease small subunit